MPPFVWMVGRFHQRLPLAAVKRPAALLPSVAPALCQSLVDCGVRFTADPHPKPLIQPCPGLAETQRDGTTNQTQQGMELVGGVLVEPRRQLCLRCSGGLNPGPLLDGGLAELRVPRPIRSRRLDNTVAKTVIWRRCRSNLLRRRQDEEIPGLGWPRQPVRLKNPGGWWGHHRQSRTEMQTGIIPPSWLQLW